MNYQSFNVTQRVNQFKKTPTKQKPNQTSFKALHIDKNFKRKDMVTSLQEGLKDAAKKVDIYIWNGKDPFYVFMDIHKIGNTALKKVKDQYQNMNPKRCFTSSDLLIDAIKEDIEYMKKFRLDSLYTKN